MVGLRPTGATGSLAVAPPRVPDRSTHEDPSGTVFDGRPAADRCDGLPGGRAAARARSFDSRGPKRHQPRPPLTRGCRCGPRRVRLPTLEFMRGSCQAHLTARPPGSQSDGRRSRPSNASVGCPAMSSTGVSFLDAAAGRRGAHTPVWFMRQAGRSLPEYRALRGEGSILDAIKRPDLAAEITLQPVRRYGVDAAVLFSDIVVPSHAVGFGIDVAPGTGPVCDAPLRQASDLARLRPFEPDADAPYVSQTVKILAAELDDDVPLLAFAGAPFTVASYLIEGRPSRTYEHTKRLMHTQPELWEQLMQRLVQHATASIAGQLDHGARAFQLFDSWA